MFEFRIRGYTRAENRNYDAFPNTVQSVLLFKAQNWPKMNRKLTAKFHEILQEFLTFQLLNDAIACAEY
jgi:hypothetical protein